MKNSTISSIIFITILFPSCFPTDVRFIEAQPEHLEELTLIPNQFQGIFVINNDTVVVTDCTINEDTINSNTLVVKGWGNYLFINSLEYGVYKLGCAKLVNSWNNENISLEYFVLLDSFEADGEWDSMDYIDNMIADKDHPLIRIDSINDFHFIFDNVSINHFQSLLNNAKSEKLTRIK